MSYCDGVANEEEMVVKIKNQIVAWLRRNCDSVDYYDSTSLYGTYLGHRVRFNGDFIQIGHSDFDRWANSVAFEFKANQSRMQRDMGLAISEARKDVTPLMDRVFGKMEELRREYSK